MDGNLILSLILLVISVALLLLLAEILTNGLEWLGKSLNLTEGTVGSIIAAVSTAMPETIIPLVAIIWGTGSVETSHEIGIGAILGAPFLLSTLAMFVTGIAVLLFQKRRGSKTTLVVNSRIMSRDLRFFLIFYTIAILSALFPHYIVTVTYLTIFKTGVAIVLFGAYIFYVMRTIRAGGIGMGEDELDELWFARFLRLFKIKTEKTILLVILQFIIALGLLIASAQLFVQQIEAVSSAFGFPVLIFTLLIAPFATELPEKFNSVIWIRKNRDTLALGNITGAMVFQSCIPPAFGILLTSWNLMAHPNAIVSAALALISAFIIYLALLIRKRLYLSTLIFAGVFYLLFIINVIFNFPFYLGINNALGIGH